MKIEEMSDELKKVTTPESCWIIICSICKHKYEGHFYEKMYGYRCSNIQCENHDVLLVRDKRGRNEG